MLDAVEETLDEISLAINPAAEAEGLSAIILCRNVRPGFPTFGEGSDGIRVIGLIGQER